MDRMSEIGFLEERIKANQRLLKFYGLDKKTKEKLKNEISKWKKRQSKLKEEISKGKRAFPR